MAKARVIAGVSPESALLYAPMLEMSREHQREVEEAVAEKLHAIIGNHAKYRGPGAFIVKLESESPLVGFRYAGIIEGEQLEVDN